MLTELRRSIASLERPAGFEAAGTQRLGIDPIDTLLGGGLAYGALHEIAAASEAHAPAATGFALGVAPSRKQIIWIAEDMALAESGVACGQGLDEFGIAPERLITVTAARIRDLLWTMEEALRCRAIGMAIAEVRHEEIDAVALRRLSLAASEHGTLALLLRIAPRPGDVSTAATRWVIRAARSCVSHGPGPPRFDANLVRNRRGPLGSWTLEWSDIDERFILASTYPEPVAAPLVHRPPGPFARSVA